MTSKAKSKKQRKAAKKLFPKVAHNERPFNNEDYKRLPKGERLRPAEG